MKHALISLALLLMALLGCRPGQKPPEQGVFEPLEFRVDSARLGDSLSIGGLHLSVPLHWFAVDSGTLAKLTNVALRDTSKLALQPFMAFKHEQGGPMLLVSKFPRAVALDAQFIPWAGEVTKVYREQRPDVLVQEQWMSLGGVEALQLYSRSAQLVHLKIILHGDEPVGLDYTVPLDRWEDEVHSVESSLGSIRKVYQ